MNQLQIGSLIDGSDAVVTQDPPASVGMPHWAANITTGNYETESEAKEDFIRHVNDDHWDVLHEVSGEVLFPKPGCDRSKVSADFILFPKPPLVASGWSVGPICIEVKKSGVKLGPVICQSQDYMRCLFKTPGGIDGVPSGIQFMPRFCVIFPLQAVGGTTQSIMSDGRIGHSHIGFDGRLLIHLNGVLAYTETGGVFLRSAMKSGKKFGSR